MHAQGFEEIFQLHFGNIRNIVQGDSYEGKFLFLLNLPEQCLECFD